MQIRRIFQRNVKKPESLHNEFAIYFEGKEGMKFGSASSAASSPHFRKHSLANINFPSSISTPKCSYQLRIPYCKVIRSLQLFMLL